MSRIFVVVTILGPTIWVEIFLESHGLVLIIQHTKNIQKLQNFLPFLRRKKKKKLHFLVRSD
jgi:hypothetical protein